MLGPIYNHSIKRYQANYFPAKKAKSFCNRCMPIVINGIGYPSLQQKLTTENSKYKI